MLHAGLLLCRPCLHRIRLSVHARLVHSVDYIHHLQATSWPAQSVISTYEWRELRQCSVWATTAGAGTAIQRCTPSVSPTRCASQGTIHDCSPAAGEYTFPSLSSAEQGRIHQSPAGTAERTYTAVSCAGTRVTFDPDPDTAVQREALRTMRSNRALAFLP